MQYLITDKDSLLPQFLYKIPPLHQRVLEAAFTTFALFFRPPRTLSFYSYLSISALENHGCSD